MISKFILKNGPGSPGQTAKILIEQYNRRNQIYMADEPHEIYLDILADRMLISQNTGQSLYGIMYDLEKITEFLENDICSFTFLVLFSESERFRESVVKDRFGHSSLGIVTDVIFEVCKKRSALCKISLMDFKQKASKICNHEVYKY